VVDGLTYREAAEKLNRQRAAVVWRVHKLGMRLRSSHFDHNWNDWTEEIIAKMRRWWLSGDSSGTIADRLGGRFTRSAVMGKLNRLGCRREKSTAKAARQIPPPNRPLRPQKITPALRPWFTPKSSPRVAPKILRDLAPSDDVARVTHNDLGARHCRWPVGDPSKVAIHREPFYCGHPRVAGLPYCRKHCRRAFKVIPNTPRQTYPTPRIN
jgi:hypothetical protein